jgi:cyclopropane fatty-acyl-phospholipid synthase-like methyltransferase
METAPDDWWKTYFGGAANDFFRQSMAARAPADAARIEKVLALPPHSKILDVPCGHGRIAIELAARGHVVTGLDLSRDEIARAKATARDRNVQVDFRIGDMRSDVPAGPFDAAACVGHSFGYFDDDDDNVSFLRSLHGCLRPDGRLAMETDFCLESYLPRFSERARPFWWKAGETYLLQREMFDHERGRMNIEQIYVAPETGVLETKRLSCRMYAYRELVALLRSCGFEDVRGLDADDEPFRPGEHLLLVGRRGRGA